MYTMPGMVCPSSEIPLFHFEVRVLKSVPEQQQQQQQQQQQK